MAEAGWQGTQQLQQGFILTNNCHHNPWEYKTIIYLFSYQTWSQDLSERFGVEMISWLILGSIMKDDFVNYFNSKWVI